MMCCTSTSRATSASDSSIRWHCHHTASAHMTATLRSLAELQQLVDRRARTRASSCDPRSRGMPRFSTRRSGSRASAFAIRPAQRSADTRCRPRARRASSASRPKWGWRRDRGIVRTSARPSMEWARSSSRNSSALRVEWPIVQIRVAGIHELPFNRRAGKHRPRRREVDLQLLFVFRRRLAGFQLEDRDAAVAAAE